MNWRGKVSLTPSGGHDRTWQHFIEVYLSPQGGECQKTKRTLKPTHFNFKNCTSVQAYKPLYCGSCSDDRCCTPHSTRTMQVAFRCPGGRSLRKLVMFINTCVCHSSCPLEDSPYHLPNHSHSIPRRWAGSWMEKVCMGTKPQCCRRLACFLMKDTAKHGFKG